MKIGKITSVNFSQFRVKISSEIRGNSVNLAGTIYYFGNIGSYLKTTNALGEILICEVVSIFDSDTHLDKHAFDIDSNRELILKPIGTIIQKSRFNLGVGVFPSIYSEVSIVTFEDMKIILNNEIASLVDDNIHTNFYLGQSKNLINYPINISINLFFNIHSAVLGNSGSGKSNTIAHIIQDIHKKDSYSAIGSRILIFDVNGEYRNAFETHSRSSTISIKLYKPNIGKKTDSFYPFYLPHFLLSLDEWCSFLLATDATQRPFWDKVLQESYRFYKIGHGSKDEQLLFTNYLKHKICSLLYYILHQTESDTTNITIALSVINSFISIIKRDSRLLANSKENNLFQTFENLKANCGLNFGKNDGKLLKAINDIESTINNDDILKVLNYRLPHGEYFDYSFLKFAIEILLLEEDARGNKRLREYTSTMITRLNYFLENPDCDFMRYTSTIPDSENAYLEELWQLDAEDNKVQMVIIDTSELAPDALETLTSVVSRLIFSSRRKLIGIERQQKPIHLILDEAHRYIKKDYKYMLKENIFEKIAREGRKYSIFLLISSQRPSELSETVLSQCANFIIHRIQNEVDMRHVYAVLPYFSEDFANKIKQSAPGEALVFGCCVSMPLHIKINKPFPEPNSKNCNITEEWFKDSIISTNPL